MSLKSVVSFLASRSMNQVLPEKSQVPIAFDFAWDLDGVPPPDLAAVMIRVRESIESGQSAVPHELSACVFGLWSTPDPEKTAPLCNWVKTASMVLAHVRQGSRSVLGGLARAFLLDWHRNMPFGAEASAILRAASDNGRMASRWKRFNEVGSFDWPGADERLAQEAQTRSLRPGELLESLGPVGGSSFDGIVDASIVSGIDRIALLKKVEVEAKIRSLERWVPIPVSMDEMSGMRQDLKVVSMTAVAKLGNQTSVGSVDRKHAQKLLVDRLGDPQIPKHRSRWEGLEEARGIVLRWMQRDNLEVFFDVIDEIAFDTNWHFRRKFWMAVHARGLINNLWVAYSRHGYDKAVSRFASRQGLKPRDMNYTNVPFGVLITGRSSKPVQNDHACIIMSIGGAMLAEWSANGRLYVWRGDALKHAPDMGKFQYGSDALTFDLRKNGRAGHSSFVHTHSSSYTWQGIVAEEIYNLTGAVIAPQEYR